MKDDLISRQEAIKAIHNEYDEVTNIDESGEWIANDVEEILRLLPPKAELGNAPYAESKWIPIGMVFRFSE